MSPWHVPESTSTSTPIDKKNLKATKFTEYEFFVDFFIFDLNKHLNRRFRNHTEEKNPVRAAKKSKAAATRMFSLPKNEVPSHMKGGPVVKHHMNDFDDFGREKYRSERKTERSWKT